MGTEEDTEEVIEEEEEREEEEVEEGVQEVVEGDEEIEEEEQREESNESTGVLTEDTFLSFEIFFESFCIFPFTSQIIFRNEFCIREREAIVMKKHIRFGREKRDGITHSSSFI